MTHSGETLRDTLHTLLRTHLQFLDEQQPIPLDDPLIDLGLDSLSAINLLLEVETAFGIVFPDELLAPETFRTAGSLEQAVQLLVDQQGAP